MITTSEMKTPRLVTALPGPKAKQVVERDAKFMSPSFTRDYPLVAKSGQGAMVEDVDGNVFLDFAAGIAVCSTGHCHPKVVAAIQKQAAELIHMSGTDFYYESLPLLAERLGKTVPGSEEKKVFFTNSGTEAVEGALKLARYATKRDKMIAFYGCFHGRTMGSLSLTASKSTQRKGFGALLGGVEHIPYPYAYRCAHGHTAETCGEEILETLENQIFKRLFDPSEVAGIIIEPIQGEGGYVPAPKFFLQELQRICRQHGIMLIADEVQSGMGRTGKWWAFEHAGIEPDIITSAKGIASGMPLGAIIARSSVMNWKPGSHGTTFGGNPVCVAASRSWTELSATPSAARRPVRSRGPWTWIPSGRGVRRPARRDLVPAAGAPFRGQGGLGRVRSRTDHPFHPAHAGRVRGRSVAVRAPLHIERRGQLHPQGVDNPAGVSRCAERDRVVAGADQELRRVCRV